MTYRGTALRTRPNPEDDLVVYPQGHSVMVQVGRRTLDLSLEEAELMARALQRSRDAVLESIRTIAGIPR